MSGIFPPQTLLGLLNCYSPTGQETYAVSYLVNRMNNLGFTNSFSDAAGNAVGEMGDGPSKILLLGHIDTVPGKIEVKQEGDLLYGRGSVDAKGPLAAFVDSVAATGPRPGWKVVVAGAVEEEGGSKGARFILDQYPADFVIIGEPSRWDRITLGYKGSAWTEIRTKKSLFHTAGIGRNACEMIFDHWLKIQQWSDDYNQNQDGMFSQVQVTMRSLNSGDDGFTEWASMQVGVRLPEDLNPKQWFDLLPGLCDSAEINSLPSPMPAFKGGKNNQLVRQFLQAIRDQNGKPAFVYKSGTSDFNIIGPAWKCPIVAFGPGDSSLDHTPDEHISISEYHLAVEVLKRVLTKLTEGED